MPETPTPTVTPANVHQHPLYNMMEGIAEIARIMGEVSYRPHDLRDMRVDAIRWAIEYEGLYEKNVASGDWREDEWLDNIDDYVRAKLAPEVDDDTIDSARWVAYFGRGPFA